MPDFIKSVKKRLNIERSFTQELDLQQIKLALQIQLPRLVTHMEVETRIAEHLTHMVEHLHLCLPHRAEEVGIVVLALVKVAQRYTTHIKIQVLDTQAAHPSLWVHT